MSTLSALDQATTPRRVVVVDDQHDIRLLLSVVLNTPADGLMVVADAVDGPTAIATVDEVEPDIVVLDYMMPGMTGIETARRLLAAHPDLVIVLCSAHLTEEVRREAAGVGIRRCVSKTETQALPGVIRELAA